MSVSADELTGTRRLRRVAGLEIRALPDGYVVYQAERQRIHYLNASAALLLELCDGAQCIDELPALAAAAVGVAEVPASEVVECLRRLIGEGLLA